MSFIYQPNKRDKRLVTDTNDRIARARQERFKFTKEEYAVAEAIYEAKYPDSKFKYLHPNRNIRLARLIEARAAIKALDKLRNK